MEHTLAYFVGAMKADLEQYCRAQLRAEGLTRGQLYFLLYIVKRPGCSPGQAAAALMADAGQATRTIDKLVQCGCVERSRDRSDRRAVVLYATQRGREVYERALAQFHSWDDEMMQTLSEPQRETLQACMTSLMDTHRERIAAQEEVR